MTGAGSASATIRVLREQVPLGTAGALTVARETLDPRFLMMNGDAFFDINLRALEQASQRERRDGDPGAAVGSPTPRATGG